MKKSIILAACALVLCSCGASKKAAPMTSVEKAVAELKADGWKLTGAKQVFTLEEVYADYREKSASGDYEPVFATTENLGFKDFVGASLSAQAIAASNYASSQAQEITVRVDGQFSDLSKDARTKIVGAFESRVEALIVRGVKEFFVVYRLVGDEYQLRGFYLIDKDFARKQKLQAMEDAIVETAAEQVVGDEIARWLHQQYE